MLGGGLFVTDIVHKNHVPQISSKQSRRTSSTKWEWLTLGKKTKWFSVDAHESCLFEGSAVLFSVAPGRNDGI